MSDTGSPIDPLLAAYRGQLDPEHPAAALIWADLASLCHVTETTFVPGDPTTSAFREGRRSVFLHLAQQLAVRLTPET